MISVIIPIYNAEQYLEGCLNCIVQQTYTALEILLINDGSTDRSGEICEKYCNADIRFKYILQPNSGVAEARNNGLKAATGEYIAFIDSDDRIHRKYFEYLYRAINEGDYAMSMVLYQETADLQSIGDTLDVPYETVGVSNEALLDDLYRSMRVGEINGKPLGVVWGKLYRRQLLGGAFFEKLALSSDIEYSVRVCWKAGQTIIVSKKMYWWVNYPNSLSHSKTYQNDKLHGMMDLWIYILKDTPVNHAEYRGFCLEMLFRKILYAVYLCDRYNKKDLCKINSKMKSYGKLHMLEFLKSRYIPLDKRVGLCLFYHIPSLYIFLRRILERYLIQS